MAINFEAANMAGYNNPKIEVFRLTINDNLEVVEAPKNSVLSDCVNRGSVPFILLTTTDRDSMYILPITYIQWQTSGLEFCFSAALRSGTAPSATLSFVAVNFPATGDPVLFTQDIPAANI